MPMHPMLDQLMIGNAVQEQGAAAVVAKTAAPGQILVAVARLLADGPHREAAARLGAKIRAHDAAEDAAGRLHAVLPSPKRRPLVDDRPSAEEA